MDKLQNPYAGYPEYNCFGCSPKNPIGLKMEFFEEGEEIVSVWDPSNLYQGFFDVLHGGIQATMMDEIASMVVFIKLDTGGVTYNMNTVYRKPVKISRGSVTIRARLLEHKRRLAIIEVQLFDGDGVKCSEGKVTYFVFPRDKAEKELRFPGKHAFYEKKI